MNLVLAGSPGYDSNSQLSKVIFGQTTKPSSLGAWHLKKILNNHRFNSDDQLAFDVM